MSSLRFLLIAALVLTRLAAQESIFLHVPDPKSKTRVELISLFSQPPPSGFLPVRVTINNTSDKPGTVKIHTTSKDYGYRDSGSELDSSFSLTAPAESVTVQDLLIPCTTGLSAIGGGGSNNVSVRMTGSFGSNAGNLSAYGGPDQPAVLLSTELFTRNASALDSALVGGGSSRYGRTNFAGKFDPRQMPEDWRAYAGYDGIGMTDSDWRDTNPGARNAILQWNRLGGQLVIYALSANSDLSSLGIITDGGRVKNADRSFGRVAIIPISSDLQLDPTATVGRFNDPSNPAKIQSIRSDYGAGWPLQDAFGDQGYNYSLFVIILIAFGILVGPVNLFVFAKSGRRHRLFITTPLIALGTSIILILIIIAMDGFGGRGVRVALMEVRPDHDENSAYVVQEQICRTGVLLGGDFELSEAATISPLPLEASQWTRLTQANDGGGMRYEIVPKNGKMEYDGDWFQSRSEQAQLVRSVIPTRGRIEARSESGPPAFLSTFEFRIDAFYYIDSSGGLWNAPDIEPGKSFVCTPALEADFNAFTTAAADEFSRRNRLALLSLKNRRGHFIAVTSSASGVETLPGIEWQNTRTYITGPIAQP